MRRRIRNFTFYFFAMLFLAVTVVAAAFFWRLSQGPVSLSFLKETVEQRVNAGLDDVKVAIKNVVVEKDETTGKPRLRMQDVQFTTNKGVLIAKAPRAAIGINLKSLLLGTVEPSNIELIGARLLIQRRKDGSIRLGFGDRLEDGGQTTGQATVPKSNKDPDGALSGVKLFTARAASLLAFLDGSSRTPGEPPTTWDLLQSVKISKTAITLFDEANSAVWFSPDASLVFRRTNFGFAIFVDGRIAGRDNPWRVELTAHYRRKTGRFKVTSRVFDVIPAELARNVFALTQLTQVQLPLSGHVEAEFTQQGKILKATAEFTAAAGKVGFPAYISEPIIIDEGLLRLDFEPKTGDIVIGNSAIFVGGAQAKLSGRIKPSYDENGGLAELGIKLLATQAKFEGDGGVKKSTMFDRINFEGKASIRQERLIVDDLTLMAGSSGLRVRGQFVGGNGAVGVFLSGRLRDLPTATIKKLWPPVVAPGARLWINNHVVSGRMDNGEFKVAIPAATLAAAIEGQPIPENMVDFRFSLKDVVTNYFEEMPTIKGASAKAFLSGDSFTLTLSGGGATMPGKHTVKLDSAVFKITELASKVPPATLVVKTSGTAQALLRLINHKPLNYLKEAKTDFSSVTGTGRLVINLKMPLARDMRKDEVSATATAKWAGGSFKQVIEGADLGKANFDISVNASRLQARGKAEINGLPSNIEWDQSFIKAKGSPSRVVVKTTVTENERKNLGMDISRFIRGRVGLKVTAITKNSKTVSTRVEADLSKSILALDEIDWVYPAGKKTRATFNVTETKTNRNITNLKIVGKGLEIRGSLVFDKQAKLLKANFPKFKLNRYNDMKLRLERRKNSNLISVSGRTFDARSLINRSFSVRNKRQAPRKENANSTIPIFLKINMQNIVANRGELIKDVSGDVSTVKGRVARADLRGKFVGGAPVALQSQLDKTGNGTLVFVSRDAGAALRAANLYSKVAGGTLSFKANVAGGDNGGIKKGLLVLRHFIIRDSKTFSAINSRARRKGKAKPGPRKTGQKFKRLTLPFSTDFAFVRIGDALIRGTEIGASANGRIRKSDGAMDIGGTIIPAYELNAAIGKVPLLGTLLTGGKGEGVFGLNYALQGTMSRPKFVVNPVSAIAPGFLRKLFSIGGGGNVGSDGTGHKVSRKLKESER